MQKEALQALIDANAVSRGAIDEASLKSRFNHKSLLVNLFEESDLESQKAVTETLAGFYKIPLLSLEKIIPSPALIRMCKPEQARQWHFLPIVESGSQVVVGMIDPTDLDNVDMLRHIFRKPIQPVFIYAHDFERGLYRFFRKGASRPIENDNLLDTTRMQQVVGGQQAEPSEQQSHAAIAEKFIRHIVSRALAYGASDLLIEPMQHESLISLRIEGGTYRLFRLSISHHDSVVSALKKLVKLNDANTGASQRCGFGLRYNNRPFRLLTHFQPSPTGERVSIRIINPELSALTLKQLELPDGMEKAITTALAGSSGLILVTGASGSGKSTAIGAFLRHMANSNRRIISLEDLVIDRISGIKQVQFPATGMAKSAALASVLKHSPDVIVIDEALDAETIAMALKAATGQCLVILGIQADGISEAISRLLRLGIARGELAEAMRFVYTQRVIRKICPDCKASTLIHPKTIQQLHIPSGFTFYAGSGCSACKETGYRGTATIGELLPFTPELSEKLASGASGSEIYTDGRYAGMLTMFEAGMNKAIDGSASLEEVLGTLPSPQSFNFKGHLQLGRIGHLKNPSTAKGEKATFKFDQSLEASQTNALADLFAGSEEEEQEASPAIAEIPPSLVSPEVPMPATGTPQQPTSDKLAVLLLDDSPVMLEYTSHILATAGFFEVHTAGTVDEAWDKLQHQHFHLVITDHEMPGQTGQEFIERIRMQPALNHTGTMLLTGNVKEASALTGGADGYVSKPTDPELLVARAKSIADIYKRMAGESRNPAQPPSSMQTAKNEQQDVPQAGRVDFTERDMKQITSFELDTQQFGQADKATDSDLQVDSSD